MPGSTYRLQLQQEFSFFDAAAVVPYLAALGVTHVYCSPMLAAAPGSTHGYDVIDHGHVNPELGGEGGLRRLVAACRAVGLKIVADIVPNHMAVSAPESGNVAWWSVLADGPASPYADWFDIDWDNPDNPGKVLLPVLGDSLAACVKAGEIRLVDDGPDGAHVVYVDHVAPVAEDTIVPGDLLATLDRQHYRLCHWRVAAEELPYRRFFDVTTLAGLRQEDPEVFAATHRLLLEQVNAGTIDGLRVDHPDGLADPEEYLHRLADATGRVWTVVEKILESGETLPDAWEVDGTTGYDSLDRLTRLFVDTGSADVMTGLYTDLAAAPAPYEDVVGDAKRTVLDRVLRPEVARLTALALAEARERRLDLTHGGLREALCAVLAAFDVYRAYVRTTADAPRAASLEARATVVRACGRARAVATSREAEIDLVEELALSGPPEFVTRFQQTCGPVMAKAVEDTAFYRYGRLLALNEVGGSPGDYPGEFPHGPVEAFHLANAVIQRDWPLTMTTLSTHDTKRSEDVRARLAVLSEDPLAWGDLARRLIALGDRHTDTENGWPDRPTIYFFLQTLVGAWPLPVDRALPYMHKVVREAKLHTNWTDPSDGYETALTNYIEAMLDDKQVTAALSDYVATIAEAGRQNALAQKLLQIVSPGVPDVYQGQELWDASLVDPDNRRPVHFAERIRLLAELDAGPAGRLPPVDDTGAAKLLVTSRALRLRRDHPDWFGAAATYRPLWASGSAAENVVAFSRSEAVVAVVPRLVHGLRRGGGWRDTTIVMPEGRWVDALTGRRHDGGTAYVLRLLRDFPVTLLYRTD